MMKNWRVGPQYGVLGIEIQNNNSSVAIARGKDFDQQMERARLIAAAPAMYEALKAIKNWYDKGEELCTNDPQFELLLKALARAEGKEA